VSATSPILPRPAPSDVVLEIWDRHAGPKEKSPPNALFVNEPKKPHAAFETVEPGLARKGNGSRIFARVRVNGKWTWRSTKTDDLELAKKWKEKWDRKQWLEKQGFVAQEAPAESGAQETKPGRGGNGHETQKENDPKSSALTCDQILDNYVNAGHPTVKKRKLKPKSPRSIQNEVFYLPPVRIYFGKKMAEQLTLRDCDDYHQWRLKGGYIAKFLLHGKPVEKRAKGGDRAVDLNLIVLSNGIELAVRQGHLKSNPIKDRGRYSDESTIRHCREVAPTPRGLVLIVDWLEANALEQDADLTRYLAYSGLRLGEGLNSRWLQVDWKEELIHVKRLKKGVFPFVLILPELKSLLRRMEKEAKGDLMFPSPFDPLAPRDDSSYRRRLAQAAKACGLPHVTPQGLRSYFVTQARQSGLTDAEIAQLIGDKTGPTLIAEVYGDVRPDHLLAVARKIRLTAQTRAVGQPSGKTQKKPSRTKKQ
jgi:integrase